MLFHHREVEHEDTLHDAELLAWMIDVGASREGRKYMADGILCRSVSQDFDGLDIIGYQFDDIRESLFQQDALGFLAAWQKDLAFKGFQTTGMDIL